MANSETENGLRSVDRCLVAPKTDVPMRGRELVPTSGQAVEVSSRGNSLRAVDREVIVALTDTASSIGQ